jgi:hypothetical protein
MSKPGAAMLAVLAASAVGLLAVPRPRPSPPPEHARVVGKSAVTADLIAGRITLPQAAARFQELERQVLLPGGSTASHASVRPGPWAESPTDGDAAQLYRRVLARVEEGVAFEPPEVADEVFGRLEREYRGLLADGQTMTVPDFSGDRRDAFLTEVRRATARAAAGRARSE